MTDENASTPSPKRARKARVSTIDLEGAAISACAKALATLAEKDAPALERVLAYLKGRFGV